MGHLCDWNGIHLIAIELIARSTPDVHRHGATSIRSRWFICILDDSLRGCYSNVVESFWSRCRWLCSSCKERDTFNQVHLSRDPEILLTRSRAPEIAIQSHLRSKKVAPGNIIVDTIIVDTIKIKNI